MQDEKSKEKGAEKKSRYDLESTHTVHTPEPDYHRFLLEIPAHARERMLGRLKTLYGEESAKAYMPELERILQVYYAHRPDRLIQREKSYVPEERFTQKDMILITYGDLIQEPETSTLKTLIQVIDEEASAINTVHILPFFPSSSDRGFSIIDFETVDPHLGTWEDIEELDDRMHLMFDGVFNHISSKSRWFQEFLNGNPYYKKFFVYFNSPDELTTEQRSRITRPRTHDILTRFQSINGPRWVWTTFSADQIDLNFRNPGVLMRIIEVLLLYVRRGADIIRLDAVTYLWSEPGTSCASLEETHEIVKLFRDVVDVAAPGVALVTETNVPHEENISYFGNGRDEAHMVYNFALPPLVLHTFFTEDSTKFSEWAAGLETPSKTTHFFNFLDSHDGFGLMGARGILSEKEIGAMIQRVLDHGGFISYKTARDGSEVPYEMNITLFSALNKDDGREDLDLQLRRLQAARSISLVLRGVPGMYLLGIIGKRNDVEAVKVIQSKRAINRTVLDARILDEQIRDPDSKLSRIFEMSLYNDKRVLYRAFHPNGDQKVLRLGPEIFAVLRTSPEGDQHILALTSVANRHISVEVPLSLLGLEDARWHDIVTEKDLETVQGKLVLALAPYDVLWLLPAGEHAFCS
jgi:glucosylglycerate phosphorylase